MSIVSDDNRASFDTAAAAEEARHDRRRKRVLRAVQVALTLVMLGGGTSIGRYLVPAQDSLVKQVRDVMLTGCAVTIDAAVFGIEGKAVLDRATEEYLAVLGDTARGHLVVRVEPGPLLAEGGWLGIVVRCA